MMISDSLNTPAQTPLFGYEQRYKGFKNVVILTKYGDKINRKIKVGIANRYRPLYLGRNELM